MKKIYCTLLLLLCTVILRAQVSTANYILTRIMRDTSGCEFIDRIQYYDGLGRPYLQVSKGAGGENCHLAFLQEYDAQGRLQYNWLPGCISQDYISSRNLKAQLSNAYGDSLAYTCYDYHTLPLDRVTSETGPGEAWAGKGKKTDYFFNSASSTSALFCRKYSVADGGGELGCNGYYAANTLSVTRATDEDGHMSYAFTNSLGQVLLVRQQNGGVFYDTYSVYDSFGRLCYVLPPMYQDNADLDLYAYQYRYDGLGRCIEKKLPGCQAVNYAYDNADRVIQSVDGVQRSHSRYTSYVYDALGRMTSTLEMIRVVGGGTDMVNSRLLNHYDRYDFLNAPALSAFKDSLSYRELAGFGVRYVNTENPSASSQGMLTGTTVDILGKSQSLYTAFYYDRKGNMIQQCSTNHLGGIDRDFYSYTFTGNVLSHRHVRQVPGKVVHTYTETYSYDDMDRLVRVTHQLDGHPVVNLLENVYDSLGRVSSKTYHGLSSAPMKFDYNIRDWLTAIHHPVFSQTLHYTDGPAEACYNGNISSMSWKSGSETSQRGYKFSYDGFSRLTESVYGEGNTLSSNVGRFNEQVTGYDKMGNILSLKRNGQTSSTTYGAIDNLTLSYTGNQLRKVTDAVASSTYNNGFGFNDGSNATTEYTYDENGNLTKDLNKKILEIQYNSLNLPSRVAFEDGSSISYVYDANGMKLHTTHVINGTTTTTDYCGNVIYENGVAKTLLTEVGYISLSDNKYHYYIQDHQGNNRAVMNQSGTVEEVNHYYPFGGIFASAGNVQAYKYNGKELDRKGGLDWYDYGARHYDAALGRWHVVDAMSEKYYGVTPYSYCGNEPVSRIDPNGNDWIQDRFGFLLWDDNATDQESTRSGWSYLGASLPNDVSGYRVLEEINGSLYHKNTINPWASLVNWMAGEDVMVEKKAYNPAEDHMMQQAVETGAEFAVGEVGGRAMKWGVGKVFSEVFNSRLIPLGRGVTGRTVATDLTEQLAMKEIMSNPKIGQIIPRMPPLTDPRWLGWSKMQYIHTAQNGSQTVIHYVGKFKNGVLKYVDDFKFK